MVRLVYLIFEISFDVETIDNLFYTITFSNSVIDFANWIENEGAE